jgi:benzodiazapine receptor
MKPTPPIKFILTLTLTFSIVFLSSLFTAPDAFNTWYGSLNKPLFTPPDWLFAPVWTILYFLMAVAAFLVWQKHTPHRTFIIALLCFVLQLLLNALWTPFFFWLKSPLLALMVLYLLLPAILLTMIVFARISRPAGLLLVPYLLWTSFAAYLNTAIYLLNK